ncbi:MAG: hypothetical protein ACI81F_000837, partial [Thalassolituus oleivorans]
MVASKYLWNIKKPPKGGFRLLINPSYLTGVYCFWGLCINIPLISKNSTMKNSRCSASLK